MKTIIIDDRKERKHQHWSNVDNELAEDLCQKGVLDIREELKSFDELKDYSLIAIHESLLKETDRLEPVINYVKEKQKFLVLFSGGITRNGLYDFGKLMKINSADFFTKILPFISVNKEENNEVLLLKFLYGSNWKLPLYFRYKNLIWIYGDTNNIDPDNDDFSVEEEIRALLFPDSKTTSIDLKTINEELDKYKEGLQ